MIEYAAFALPIFLLVIVILLLWSVVGARGRWGLKLLFILVIPLSTVVVWSSLRSYLGWPTNEELPARFLIYWAIVDEPDQQTEDPGSIYFWVRARQYPVVPLGKFFGYRYDPNAPRGYWLPYSRKLHEQIAGMQSEFREGRPVVGENKGLGKGEKEGKVGHEGDRDKGTGNPYGAAEGDINLYRLPPVQLPAKDPPPPRQ